MMDIYQVRLFNGSKWNTVQTYQTRKEAQDFAIDNLSASEWCVRRVNLEQAIAEESN